MSIFPKKSGIPEIVLMRTRYKKIISSDRSFLYISTKPYGTGYVSLCVLKVKRTDFNEFALVNII